jgi:hypothetical protein
LNSSAGAAYPLFAVPTGTTDSTWFELRFISDFLYIAGYSTNWRITSQVFRDPSAWYHIVLSVDTTQATANDRLKLYVNGTQVTTFSTTNNPTQNADLGVNQAAATYIGFSNTQYFDGYLTEINFIDGQALTPSDFGETDSATGVWKPKAYSGTYGTNGFYLKFADNSGTTSTTLGKDSSGNGNNWTPNNFSVTAGAGNDSLVDSPTAYGTDSGLGAEVRGNYCTLNALWKNSAWSPTNGNLTANMGSGTNGYVALGSFAMPAGEGKWYFEIVFTSGSPSSANQQVGIVPISGSYAATQVANTDISNAYSTTNGYAYNAGGTKNSPAGRNATYTGAASWGVNDVVGVAFDAGAGTLTFYKNGVSQGQAFSGITTSEGFYPAIADYAGLTVNINCGQRPWYSTAPSGFKALCTQNLPTPTIGATSTTQANKYFTPYLYTADGTSPKSRTGIGFAPDFLWFKSRSTTFSHALYDQVRGTNKGLQTNTTAAENTYTLLSTFGSDGFTTTTDGTVGNILNDGTNTYVTWAWKANGAGSTNTAGTITSTVSANTTAGFSIATYTGNGSSSQTVGHGLGVAPGMVIIKTRSNSDNWRVWHTSLTSGQTLTLNSTAAQAASGFWPSNPSTSVVYLGTDSSVNSSTWTYVMYSFAPVAGYSAFGSYTGNGSADGPFVYTGFRPAFVLIKRTDSTSSWWMMDSKRDPYNVNVNYLIADGSGAEATYTSMDFLSNGFKPRNTSSSFNSGTHIYMAFAENPFKYSLAR